jgi:hypothetical protein
MYCCNKKQFDLNARRLLSNLFFIAFSIFSTNALSASCAQALEEVFGNEGGYQNSRNDGGNWSSKKVGVGKMCGGTKYGIACAYNPGVDIKNLTKDQAAKIYQNRECKEIRMSELNGRVIPTFLLDLAVNMGVEMAIKLMGTTINILNPLDKQIKFNDVMTDEMVNWYNENTKTRDGQILFFSVLTLTAIDRYVYIVESNKKQSVWLLGWIRRAIPNEIELIRPNKNPD